MDNNNINSSRYNCQRADEDTSNEIYKDQRRFVDYSFGNVQTQNLEITGTLILNNIVTGNPVDGGTVVIPPKAGVVILQNTVDYTQLTIRMPLLPEYGQTLTLVSTVDIPNLTLDGSFGTTKPTTMLKDIPLRLIFAGLWYNI